MFGGNDSFAENSILAQFDDLEQKHMQISDHRTHDVDVTAEKFHSEDIKRNKFSVLAEGNLLEERIDDSLHDSQSGNGEVSEESEINVLFDMPSSQLFYFENLYDAPDTLDNQTAAIEQAKIPSYQKTDKEELPHTSTEQPPKINDSSSHAQPSSDVNRRKSLKERLKSAMTSNARVQTPAFSKTKQLKETLLNEEINVAKKTIELSSDDLGPFYSLPSKNGSIHA
ncbi:helicase POLQ-like [Suncus etruscus]|uniref:helicase POLQ-like n=1 Tax=Suncus etruscus TaxID=109475 RepID=UPI002110A196|nr:helicase POLQ-like [Suncus etruscus]